MKNGNERNWAKLGFQKGISKILVTIRIKVGQHGSGEGAQITAAVFMTNRYPERGEGSDVCLK